MTADNQKIVFVCHSMGRIVVRKFLVERVNDLLDRNTEIGLFHELDVAMREAGLVMLRYADDAVLLCRSREEAQIERQLCDRSLSQHKL